MKARRKAVTPDRDSVQARRLIGLKLTVASAAVAMFASGLGMWKFIGDLPTLNHWYLILPMFLLFDLAAVACAWNARINRLAYGRMGTEGWLVWLFAVLSGLMSASDAEGMAALYRFAAPLVAAILFELLIRGERHDLTNIDGPLARIRRRALARFGLLDDVDQDDEEAARARMAAKLATAAYRVHQTLPGTRARRAAVRRYHRRLGTASVRMGFATNEEMIDEVRLHLDALYSSVTGTAPGAVADLNVWQSAALVSRGDDDQPVADDDHVPELEAPATATFTSRPAHFSAARRPRRRGRLAGRAPGRKAAQAPTAPAPAAIPAWRLGPDPEPLRQQYSEPIGPRTSAMVLSGPGDSRETVPVLLAVVDEQRVPAGASAAGTTRPATVSQSTGGRVRSRVASTSRKGKAGAAATPEQLHAAAQQYWVSERAAGRNPSAGQIAKAVGAAKSSVHRWSQDWSSEQTG